MASVKVSEMVEATHFDDNDYAMIVQGNQNKKISKENMFKNNPNEFIVVTISDSQLISTNSQVIFNQNILEQGNFTLLNGNIIIGENINHIRVSGSVFVENWAGSTNYLWNRVKKNSTYISGSINGSTGSFLSASIPYIIIDVEENDIISLIVDSPSGGTLRSGSANTWLCIEKID